MLLTMQKSKCIVLSLLYISFHSQTVILTSSGIAFVYTIYTLYSESVKGVMQQTLLVSVEVVLPRQKVCS